MVEPDNDPPTLNRIGTLDRIDIVSRQSFLYQCLKRKDEMKELFSGEFDSLPNSLQQLNNLINGAANEPNHSLATLRLIIKKAADEAPAADVLQLAKCIFECGVTIERAKDSRFN